ncbi:F-box protein At2g32560 [Linum perenne]
MILYLFIACFSFILLLKPLLLLETKLISVYFQKDLAIRTFFLKLCYIFRNHSTTPSVHGEETMKVSMLDLPELALDNILERLPPAGLCSMAGVCSSLRERCTSDDLWEKHLNQKWGKVIGRASSRSNWRQWDDPDASSGTPKEWLVNVARSLLSSIGLNGDYFSRKEESRLGVDSTAMAWYLALESGRFWFPAQVYNRENGYFGFLLSCYDADLSYDPRNDSFQARYPPHGRRPIIKETGVQWERIRAPLLDTCASPHQLHISDCLDDLRPGDHIEIQWRRNKEFPYGWWYGVVGHVQECDGNQQYCRCHDNDTVVLDFQQYSPESRWRQTTVKRMNHREEGNETSGFFGGIRKLTKEDEISRWKLHWPLETLR